MSNRQQFVQQYSENDMVLKVRARDRRRARTTLATVSRGSFRPSRTTLPLTRPDRSFRLFRENERAQELERLEDDANVYKLIGPVLIKQDLVEAKSNVEKRLEFIQNEKLAQETAQHPVLLIEGLQERSLSRSPDNEEFKNLRELNVSKSGVSPQGIRQVELLQDVPMGSVRNGGSG